MTIESRHSDVDNEHSRKRMRYNDITRRLPIVCRSESARDLLYSPYRLELENAPRNYRAG